MYFYNCKKLNPVLFLRFLSFYFYLDFENSLSVMNRVRVNHFFIVLSSVLKVIAVLFTFPVTTVYDTKIVVGCSTESYKLTFMFYCDI